MNIENNNFSIESEGKNVREAIKIALEKLSVAKDKVDVAILSEGTRGLFGMVGSKPAKVKVSLKKPASGNHSG